MRIEEFKQLPLNQADFAKRIGMNPSLLSYYISGKRELSVKQEIKIKNGLIELGKELMKLDVTLTEEDFEFLRECNLYQSTNGLTVLTEDSEGAHLEREDIIKLSDIFTRYANTLKP